jgi:hypothetical protein
MIDITKDTLPHLSEPEINATYNRRKKVRDDDYGTFAVPLVYGLPRPGRTITVKPIRHSLRAILRFSN